MLVFSEMDDLEHVEDPIKENVSAAARRQRPLHLLRRDSLYKPWPRIPGCAGVSFDPSNNLTSLALAAGQATGHEIYGVNFVIGPDGPVIVDMSFPGFRGVPGGADGALDRVKWRASETAAGRV